MNNRKLQYYSLYGNKRYNHVRPVLVQQFDGWATQTGVGRTWCKNQWLAAGTRQWTQNKTRAAKRREPPARTVSVRLVAWKASAAPIFYYVCSTGTCFCRWNVYYWPMTAERSFDCTWLGWGWSVKCWSSYSWGTCSNQTPLQHTKAATRPIDQYNPRCLLKRTAPVLETLDVKLIHQAADSISPGCPTCDSLCCFHCNSLPSLLSYSYRHTVIQVITQYLT